MGEYMGASVWSTLVNMFLFTLYSLLAFSQAQQSGTDWCHEWQHELGQDVQVCSCIAGSKLDQKMKEVYQQCSHLTEDGWPAGRSIFGSKRGVEERQTSDGQCPPVSEMGIAVNDPNPGYPEDSMTDCVLGAMDFIAAEGYPRNKQITRALDSIIMPSVVENFSYGNNTRQRRDNCRNGMYSLKNHMIEWATECGDAYTEEEAKAMKFYGSRYDAFQCLTDELSNACQNAFFSYAYTTAWTGDEDYVDYSGSEDFYTVY